LNLFYYLRNLEWSQFAIDKQPPLLGGSFSIQTIAFNTNYCSNNNTKKENAYLRAFWKSLGRPVKGLMVLNIRAHILSRRLQELVNNSTT